MFQSISRRLVVLFTLIALLVPMVPAPVSAGLDNVAREIHALRELIESNQDMPESARTSLLAKVDDAETALLLPAVQSAREAARVESRKPHEIVVIGLVMGLQREHQTLNDRLGYDADGVIDRQIQVVHDELTYAWDLDDGPID